MLCLYRGLNSGTNPALLGAWQSALPQLDICQYDLHEIVLGTVGQKLAAIPHALRAAGPGALLWVNDRFGEAVKRSGWYMRRLAQATRKAQEDEDFDFSLSIGTIIPVLEPKKRHFIYSDLTILANLYYPNAQAIVEFWREYLPYERQTLQRATAVFTASSMMSRSLVEHYGLDPAKVVRVNTGCNTPPVENPDPSRHRRQNVLFIGVQWQRKGGPELVAAFSKVRKQFPQASLTIVGCKPRVSGPGIEVVGLVPPQRVSYYLGRASIFCMPSRREPLGVVYLEAMRAGLPVVACDLGAVPDFVTDGQTGYKVKLDDIDGLADRLESLLANPQLCSIMGQRAKEFVESHYTWKRVQQAMWNVIKPAMEQSGNIVA